MDTSASPSTVPTRRPGVTTARILQVTLSVAVVLATLFTGLPARLLTAGTNNRLDLLLTPEAPLTSTTPGVSAPLKIGIVSGHWGNDSGTVCSNGTTESQVNLSIAQLVQQKLSALNYDVDLLMEFDPRLDDYEAALLISIHADSCEYVNEEATGFKVASSYYGEDSNLAARLTSCLIDRYGIATGLPYHSGSITYDMTEYHAFSELDPTTTAAIIETGFLYKDYDILTQNPGLIADGIVAGILCTTNDTITGTPSAPTP